MDDQEKLLSSVNPFLQKEAMIDGQIEEIRNRPDSSIWASELEIFRSLDINKPTLKDSYRVQERDNTLSYISKDREETSVDSLVIKLDKNQSPQFIEAYLEEKNSLFYTSKRLEMSFETMETEPLLTKFTIAGIQKMTTSDTTKFTIVVEVLLP